MVIPGKIFFDQIRDGQLVRAPGKAIPALGTIPGFLYQLGKPIELVWPRPETFNDRL
jgi:hypothetical protein